MEAEKNHTLDLQINGRTSQVQVPLDQNQLSLSDLLDILEVKPEMVALEVDELVIDRTRWADFKVDPSNRIEIMKFVGGG